MNELLAEVVADELSEEECYILDSLLYHDWRLLVVPHDIGMVSLVVNRLVNPAHLLL